MLDNEIGRMLFGMRKKSELTQNDVYEGLCGKKVYMKIEEGWGNTEELLVERIMSRMQIQFRLLNIMVGEEDFNKKELRYKIDMYLHLGKVEAAKQLILEYEKYKTINKLHIQYIKWKNAQIAEYQKIGNAGEMYKEALEMTLSIEELERRIEEGKAFAAEEMEMYLGYRRCCCPLKKTEYKKILFSLERTLFNNERCEVFHIKLGFLYAKKLYDENEWEECIEYCRKLKEYLIKANKQTNLCEISFLETKAQMRTCSTEKEKIQIKKFIKKIYLVAQAMNVKQLQKEIDDYMEKEEWRITN